MGVVDMVSRGPFGLRGGLGRRRAFGYRSRWRPRRRSRWPQILLGLLILAVVYALLSREDRQNSWW
jgi:hypothetical protein